MSNLGWPSATPPEFGRVWRAWPQGTVLGPLLFIIMIADINRDVDSSKLISFADDTRVYRQIADIEECESLQQDLNSVYKWASDNNMFFNAKKFHYLPLSSSKASNKINIYINQGRMHDFSGGGPNFKISGILYIHAAKRHVASSEAASLC